MGKKSKKWHDVMFGDLDIELENGNLIIKSRKNDGFSLKAFYDWLKDEIETENKQNTDGTKRN